jgi:hypothetical protein
MAKSIWLAIILSLNTCYLVAGVPIENLVPDSETAIRVGSAILEAWMGKQRFDAMIKDAPLRADYSDGAWSVYSYRSIDQSAPKREANGEASIVVAAGGGQPVLVIAKRDAQVREIYFAR